MAKLVTTEKLVYAALVNNPATRSDDYLLILDVLGNYVSPQLTLATVMQQHILLGIPSIETITRCRRKLQSTHPELVDQKAAMIREEEKEGYIQYALDC